MKLAILTRNADLFRLICECFVSATCTKFADDLTLARALYRDEYSAIIIDADTGVNALRPVLARRACYADRRAPLIVVGAKEDRHSIAQLLDAGADDVVLAPIDTRELALRVYLAWRHFSPAETAELGDHLERGVYRFDRHACSVFVSGEQLHLTPREFAIAWLLFLHAGEYVSRRQIASNVWGDQEDIVRRTLEQHIYKLRKKLGLDGRHGATLRTMYAHGYRVEIVEAVVRPQTDTASAGMPRSMAGDTFAEFVGI
ncbi:response regulator transcription factor [Paraburkholderia sediminicola]|uniref:response regulator transcription factor n=1 Tax=Paraburkholderia sediminicola TaxID=458836 RepID=UPI0038BD3BC9